MNLSQLALGAVGVIHSFTDLDLSVKLMEMGCLPGERVCIRFIAPFGDPIAIDVSGYCLSLRRKEAATIILN